MTKRYVKWLWNPRHWFVMFGTYDSYTQTIRERRFGPLYYTSFTPKEGTE